jgi:very-short-patch-repair endonuclease
MKNILTIRARTLRKHSTPAERQLWRLLRHRHFRHYKFKRQYPIGPYIADFICYQKKLIIELDGGQHLEASGYDEKRSEFLRGQGYRVLRFWNNQVFEELDGVLEVILKELG